MPKDKNTRLHPVQSESNEKDDASCPAMCKEGKGVRNFACLNYDICLDRAAKAMWPGFTCRECCNYVSPREEEDSQ